MSLHPGSIFFLSQTVGGKSIVYPWYLVFAMCVAIGVQEYVNALSCLFTRLFDDPFARLLTCLFAHSFARAHTLAYTLA